MSAAAAKTRSNTRFCTISRRDSGRRVSCRLASGPSVDEFDFVELVQDLLGPEMNFDRQRQEGLGAAIDGLGRRPRQQHEDRVGLEAADAGDRLGEVAIEHGAPRFGRRGGRPPASESGSRRC